MVDILHFSIGLNRNGERVKKTVSHCHIATYCIYAHVRESRRWKMG
jgi:hypothetical protein